MTFVVAALYYALGFSSGLLYAGYTLRKYRITDQQRASNPTTPVQEE